MISFLANAFRTILNLANPTESIKNNAGLVLTCIEQIEKSNIDPALRREYINFANQLLGTVNEIYHKLISTKKQLEAEVQTFDNINTTREPAEITIDPFYLLYKYYPFLDPDSVDFEQEKSLILPQDQCVLLLNIIESRYKVFIEDFMSVIEALPENLKSSVLSNG